MFIRNKKYISINGYTPRENREIGRAFYRLVFIAIFGLCLSKWGLNIADDFIIFLISLSSYKLTGYLLHKTGFWPKWSWF